MQEAKQKDELTRVSQKVDSVYLESEGYRGNVRYSVMDPRNPLTRHRVVNGKEENAEDVRTDKKVKLPSFSPLWIPRCGACLTRNEETSA